jgi:hypothetical protein
MSENRYVIGACVLGARTKQSGYIVGDATTDAAALATAAGAGKKSPPPSSGGIGGVLVVAGAGIAALIAWPHIKRWL